MRPEILNRYFASASALKGIGAKVEKTLAGLVRPQSGEPGSADLSARLVDLLFHLPVGVIDRRNRPTINNLPPSGIVTIEAEVGRHKAPPRHNKRVPYRVEVFDETGSLPLVFFHSHGPYLERTLPEGETRFISGKIEWYDGTPQIVHPDHVLTAEQFSEMPLLEPVYPLTAGVSGKVLGKAIRQILADIPQLPEWQDAAWIAARKLPEFQTALETLHSPQDTTGLEPDSPARQRLAYDELLANQLALSLVRRHMKRATGRTIKGDGRARQNIIDALPFSLTVSQELAVSEILADMASPDRMLRLLQGDVGSGKTIVGLLAMATSAEAGTQSALMVPTDILARQHIAGIEPLAQAAGLRAAVLTGREKGAVRQQLLDDLASGDIDILVGTHALFQEGVGFADLGLVIIDEQHRFGVHQRLALQSKSKRPSDLLVMTATPIPRTLALTAYGDMDITRLTGKPAGRQPIDTRVMPLEKLDQITDGLERAVAQGKRAYWVCPLVEESDFIDKTAAEARFTSLKTRFGDKVGLVHGRMKGAEKDTVMARFKTGELSILVSTTVIEVGVDVPEASIMIIENAERFGLAQLHQLRGRVGRGSDASSCVLIYDGVLGETAAARLKTMRETEDGFIIAEEDLKLRGSGEVLGTRQSGVASFRLADLGQHGELLQAARDDAKLILETDPHLTGARSEALRIMLYLFERDDAIRLLSAG
ncbi:ATP-dependent DNA helicase RecG [Anderseniella sp. Alg231-50]|uniref:ATP-dependent DNA helicase RecG n=1 Tax=Anderseniella sp. Alg231-50 TaxID=1922226 RepID=UPI000D552379